MPNINITCTLLFGCLCTAVYAQYPNVKIAENKQGGFGPCEPSIFVNPKNPQNIVAGSILNRVHYSFDGGKTWEHSKLTSTYGVYGDPCVIADKHGHFYYFHLSDPDGQGWSSDKLLDRIVCQKSIDGGKTWNKGSFMGFTPPKDQDKEWAVADPKSGNIYTTWTQFDKYDSKSPKDSTHILFSRSTDGGKSWSTAVRINQIGGDCLDDDKTVEGAVPTVGTKGEIYVAWAVNDKIYFDKSTNHGKTWLKKDITVGDIPSGWSIDIPGIGRANGMPVTGCDLSESKHKGTIYVNWSDQRHGDTDIWLSKSTDGGDTWSAAKKVNDDDSKRHQFFNWMAVDPVTGYIYIIFYDRRNYTDEQTDVYLAYSTDGGETFTNEKVSESPFKPNPMTFFGDYNNISAYNGIVRPIWTRQEGVQLSIWTALINK
jgi:hypothetical protein